MPAPDRTRLASAWVLSAVAHAALIAAGAILVARSLADRPAPLPPTASAPIEEIPVELDLPVMSDGSLTADAPPEPAPPVPDELARGGGEGTARPDEGRPGRGGADASAAPALNLADRDDGGLLSAEVLSRLDRSQIQRIRSAAHRASREDWRASREPMELTFLAGGRGARAERRRPADADPSLGARAMGAPHRAGVAAGAAPLSPGEVLSTLGGSTGTSPAAPPNPLPQRVPGAPEPGAERASEGLGVPDAQPGPHARDSADVAFARPMVQQSFPSVPASAVGRPHDNVDSDQEVATTLQSLLHASPLGGAPGAGPGGQRAPAPPAAGGAQGPGAISRPLGDAPGPAPDPRAAHRQRYLRQVMSRIGPHWANAFPRWAAAEGLQGTVIISFVIRADGSVAGARVTRPSGIPEFDENCRRAVLRAAPYPPLPVELGPTLSWSMPFHASNPAVLPRRP